MWVMAASPLMTCVDVRNLSSFVRDTLTNPEVMEVHKDPLVRMATRIDVGGGAHELESASICPAGFPVCQETDTCGHCPSEISVYAKPLHDNSTAVMILNRGATSVVSQLLPVDLGAQDGVGIGVAPTENYDVRDLWDRTWLCNDSSSVSLNVPAHGVRLLRLWPSAPPTPRACPSGWTPHDGGFWANLDPCNECPHDHVNDTSDLCAAKCTHTIGCEAFEVYNGPDDAASCFIFVGGLKPPFTANPDCLTCVKPPATTLRGQVDARPSSALARAERGVRQRTRKGFPAATQQLGFSLGNGTFLLDGNPFRILAGSLQHFRIPEQV